VAVRSAGAQSYGGQSLAHSPGEFAVALWREAEGTPRLVLWFIPVLLALSVWPRPRPMGTAHIAAAGTVLLWCVPQYLLYATRGGFWDHYWMPCMLGLAGGTAGAVNVLRLSQRRGAYFSALIVLSLWGMNAARIDLTAVTNFVERARVQQRAVATTAAALKPNDQWAVAASSPSEIEISTAFMVFVAAARTPRAVPLLFDVGDRQLHYVDGLARRGSRVPMRNLALVVLLPSHSLLKELAPLPLPPRRVVLDGTQRYLSLRSLRLVRIPYQIHILLEADPRRSVEGNGYPADGLSRSSRRAGSQS
jgi:hypothetical protein